jgi:plastocyanin
VRIRRGALGTIAGLVAFAAPAVAQAATKTVYMGPPPTKAVTAIQHAGSDANDFFPRGITVHVGDSVKFIDVGFHTLDLPPTGGQPANLFAPTGQKVSGSQDAAGQPFWFNGQDQLYFDPALLGSNFGKKLTFNGSKEILSGGPFAAKIKPITVKFLKTGSFTYYCNFHPGMKGTVAVKAKKAKIPTAKDDIKVVKTQVKAFWKIAKTLTKKTVPANSVSVGSAGPHGVEYYGFLPGTITVPVGTTLTFQMSQASLETHTATTGPGNPETEPNSYLGQVAASLQGTGPFDPRALYPSEPAGAAATLKPTLHGNGFWSSGAIDNSSASPTFPASNSVKFGAAGQYEVYCLIHPFMHGTVKVQ